MYLLEDIGTVRRVGFAAPNFDLPNEMIHLTLYRKNLKLKADNSGFEELPKEKPQVYRIEYVSNEILIDTATLAIDNETGVPAYNYFMAATPNILGIPDMDSSIYSAIATQVETFLTVNNLHLEQD